MASLAPFAVAASITAFVLPGSALARCEELLPEASAGGTERLVTPDDLVRLRDIGLPDGSILGWPSPLAVSPDGRRVAFLISRADPVSNSYCRGLALIDLMPGGVPRLVDRGGEPILSVGVYRNLFVTNGFPEPLTPQWSPDGKWIAWLRRDHGSTQIWIVSGAGGEPRALTRSSTDVEVFAWRPDSSGLAFASRSGKLAEAAADRTEALSGYHYDERWVPTRGNRPQPSASIAREAFTVEIADGAVSSASPADRSLFPPEDLSGVPPVPAATGPGGARAWTEPGGTSPLSPLVLHAVTTSGVRAICPEEVCSGTITGLWWLPGGQLLFLQREGWAKGEMALYRWRPGTGHPRRILSTTDVLDGCVLAGVQLLCLRETATTPRRLVMLDPTSGVLRLLYDPNPEFAHIRLGRVSRLHWRNDIGLEVRGDLVLPPGYRPGTRLPLIVTQYFSNGFLRGGTGDEYPIHAFAAHGFAVLSLERPTFAAAADPTIKDYEAVNAANLRGWAERRSLLSAVLAGVQLVVDSGIADPERIGITGLSDGASTVAFGLINSDHFAAAIMSTCCLEPWTMMSAMGIAYADRMRRLGYPPATADNRSFWAPASIARNAAKIDTPLLMQLSDDEYAMSLEAFAALREQGKPVDLYVFPDEHHVKWQPAHRLAVYERNLDWFDFWFTSKVDADPRKREQFARWQQMRNRAARRADE